MNTHRQIDRQEKDARQKDAGNESTSRDERNSSNIIKSTPFANDTEEHHG